MPNHVTVSGEQVNRLRNEPEATEHNPGLTYRGIVRGLFARGSDSFCQA
jgi:hypothetical protein